MEWGCGFVFGTKELEWGMETGILGLGFGIEDEAQEESNMINLA